MRGVEASMPAMSRQGVHGWLPASALVRRSFEKEQPRRTQAPGLGSRAASKQGGEANVMVRVT